MEKVVGFFLSSTGTLILFAITFGAQIWASRSANQGKLDQAATLCWIALISACLLAVSYLAVAFLAMNFVTGLFSLLWGYFAWRDWQLLKQIQARRGR